MQSDTILHQYHFIQHEDIYDGDISEDPHVLLDFSKETLEKIIV